MLRNIIAVHFLTQRSGQGRGAKLYTLC
jgi:hypothetical protein